MSVDNLAQKVSMSKFKRTELHVYGRTPRYPDIASTYYYAIPTLRPSWEGQHVSQFRMSGGRSYTARSSQLQETAPNVAKPVRTWKL